ncbi:hypothetical protein RRG08_065074 [Elysia crispata]|uniref:Enoyl reductase (ER) domain-containing protein n=1 Tax=Elysia crispata TaxID=231223 RepID=A0AAE1E6J0_9GAST|nr:hypothetical protein RRG08_065074 [Elysia crispata]
MDDCIRETMRAVSVHSYGGPENLHLETDAEVPSPAENEVLIKVSAAGVNPIETFILAGTYGLNKPSLPYTPGTDAAGVVEEVGSGVTNFKKGDRVYTTCTMSGAYAEFATAESVYVNHLADSLTFAQGACIGVPYYTAAKALLIRGQVKEGETIVIHGASGAVGMAAVQISKALGLTVVGTAGTNDGLDLLKELGADLVVNHRDESYIHTIKDAVGGADVILEVVANVNLEKDIELIKLRGRILVVGSRGHIEWDPFSTVTKECSVMGVNIRETTPSEWEEMHNLFTAGQECGWLQPKIAREYPLSEAAASHRDVIHHRGIMGKLVLDTAT